MVVTEKQRQEFEKLARPMIEWLNNNCHPHCSVNITQDSAELLEGVCVVNTKDYILD